MGCESVSDGLPRYILKMIIVGDEGPVKKNLVSELLWSFEGDDYATIGASISTMIRDIGGISIKVVVWAIAGQDDLAQLRRAYFQNTNLVLLTVESTDPEYILRCKDIVEQIIGVAGRVPISVLSWKGPSIDRDVVQLFAKEIDASYVLYDSSNYRALLKSIDGMLREVLRAKGILGD